MITFWYTIQGLIDRINYEVLYEVRKLGDATELDENAIIDAETLINKYLKTASAEIFAKYTSPLGKALQDLEVPVEPYEFDITFTHPDTAEDYENTIVFRIDPTETFDQSVKYAIETAIEDSMVNYCVFRWLKSSNVESWQIYKGLHDQRMQDLCGLMTKRINLKRTYKLY